MFLPDELLKSEADVKAISQSPPTPNDNPGPGAAIPRDHSAELTVSTCVLPWAANHQLLRVTSIRVCPCRRHPRSRRRPAWGDLVEEERVLILQQRAVPAAGLALVIEAALRIRADPTVVPLSV